MKYGYVQLYVDGKLSDSQSKERHSVICPASDEVIGEVAKAGPADAEIALKAAGDAFKNWSVLPVKQRIDWVLKFRDAIDAEREIIQEVLMYETGKPYSESEMEVGTLLQSITYFCEEMNKQKSDPIDDPDGGHSHEMRYEPLGVVVSYLPWNFPLETLSFKLAPALVTGCTIIIKPSPGTPLATYMLGEICHKIGFPAGVVQFMYGDNDILPPALSGSPIPSLLTAVGSFATGRKILEQGNTTLKRYCFELGGNAPAIVFDDADIENAKNLIFGIKTFNAGQVCIAPNRIFLHKSIADEFTESLIENLNTVKIGFGREADVNMGPLTNKEARERIHSWVQSALEKGAECLVGGDLSTVPDAGSYYPPTIIKGVTPEMQLYKGEIFGPVFSLIEFDDDDMVLEMANDTEAGLSSFLFTTSDERVSRFSQGLKFGEVMVGTAKWAPHLPHLGIKQSGMGLVGSSLALHEFQNSKRVTVPKD
jgi:succinate-semialdehyde dehydrogenase/glutarate-semialdehyde dehydrogenase